MRKPMNKMVEPSNLRRMHALQSVYKDTVAQAAASNGVLALRPTYRHIYTIYAYILDMCVYTYIYIYIYIERERERAREIYALGTL